jgi:hypothetical protein
VHAGGLLYGIDLDKTWVIEEAQAGYTKDGVENVYHVTGSVSDATQLWVLRLSAERKHNGGHPDAYLALKDERRQLGAIDPVQLIQHGEAAQHPPAVADVLFLLRAAIEAPVLQLPLTEPRAQLTLIYQINSTGNG